MARLAPMYIGNSHNFAPNGRHKGASTPSPMPPGSALVCRAERIKGKRSSRAEALSSTSGVACRPGEETAGGS